MKPLVLLAAACVLLLPATAPCAEHTLKPAGAPPEHLPDEIRQALADEGHLVSGPEGVLCEIWLAKTPARNKNFTPDLRVKYPFEVGALVGVLRVGEAGKFTDFREQVILPGLYTLRYGQQPQDGNHIGTSQQADFLLALPADNDRTAAKLDDADELQAQSATAAGSSHPAIFSLLAPEVTPPDKPTLTHLQAEDFWVLQTAGSDNQRPALRLVVVGSGEE